MIQFILNNTLISTDAPAGMTLLDFVRYEKNLVGTKIGCREGDCGACTLLMGEMANGHIRYQAITSCVTPLGNTAGKHVVSIEGLNREDLTPVQQAIVDEGGTQCGFCTVGFVVAFTALCLSDKVLTYDDIISGVDGNICRCTGYKSIERAAEKICDLLRKKNLNDPIRWLIEHQFIPAYFETIPDRLKKLSISSEDKSGNIFTGGGTDLYVQRHDEMEEATIRFLSQENEFPTISISGNRCTIGASVTPTMLMESADLQRYFPKLKNHLKLVSSTLIRNIGTLAGNFVNASPIGDLTAFFIALNASITLRNAHGVQRTLLLKDFYKGYKTLDKSADEQIIFIAFELPDSHTFFNFEKVSKRTYLDIASVNTAISIRTDGSTIATVYASAGGVGPIPIFLKKTCDFLTGKPLTEETLHQALDRMQQEIAPISDARGTETYKRLLLRQLFTAHFIELFPEKFNQLVFV